MFFFILAKNDIITTKKNILITFIIDQKSNRMVDPRGTLTRLPCNPADLQILPSLTDDVFYDLRLNCIQFWLKNEKKKHLKITLMKYFKHLYQKSTSRMS